MSQNNILKSFKFKRVEFVKTMLQIYLPYWFLHNFDHFFFFTLGSQNGSIVCLFLSSPELCSGRAIVITFRPSSIRASVRASVCLCVRPSVRPSVNIFKRLLLYNRWANFAQISYGASLGWGNEKLLKWSRSVDQDGRHAHIWLKPLKIFSSRTENALGLNLCRNHQGWEVYQNC